MKRFKSIYQSGFSFLEIMLTISLMIIIALAGINTFNQVKNQEDLTATALHIVQILNTARSNSIAGKQNSAWKVVLEVTKVSLKNNQDITVEEYYFPPNHTLFSPLSEIVFDKADGRVQSCQTGCLFEVQKIDTDLSHQFKVLFSGAIEY